METLFVTIRAIGSQLALRLFIPAVITVILGLILIVSSGIWLTTLSNWWWLLFIPITIAASVALGIALVAWLLIRYVRPPQTKAQKQAVGAFVTKLQGITDVVGTPKFIILFRVVRSITAPKKDSYVADLANSRELAHDFRELQRLFSTRI